MSGLHIAANLLLFLAAFGVLNKLSFKDDPLRSLGALMLLIGAVGEVLSDIGTDQPWTRAMLPSGMTVYLLVEQRAATWAGERWARPVAIGLFAAAWASFAAWIWRY